MVMLLTSKMASSRRNPNHTMPYEQTDIKRSSHIANDWVLEPYLVGFETLCSLFLFLLPNNDEGAAVFVESETHI